MDGMTVRLHNDNMNWWLELPTTYEKLLNAMTEMGAADGNFTIDRCRTGFGGKLDKLITGSDLAAVNYFAIRLEELSPEQTMKLEALVDSPMRDVVFQSMERLIDFTYNTDFVELIPGVHNAEGLARHYLDYSGDTETHTGWAARIDLQKFGEILETEKAGCYTKHGYLTPTGTEWKPVFERTGKIPPDYQIQPESGRNAPVYPHSIDFARQNGETQLYRESLTQNMFCALDIEETVRKHNTGYGYRPDRAVVQGVIDRFGQERVLAVLAHTVRERDFGVRYSQESRDWAKSFPAPPPSEYARFTVESHPAIVDDLIALARGIVREREADIPDNVRGYELGFGFLGNGLTVWNRLEERNRDYVTVAHIGPDRAVTIYDKKMPEEIRAEIETVARTSKGPHFHTPPIETQQASAENGAATGEKSSVLEQIRAAREAPNTTPAKPGPERGKKTQGPEL